MRLEAVDRPALWEWSPWPTTLRLWQQQGLGQADHAPAFDECDRKLQCGVDLWMIPRFEERVIAKDDQSITTMTERGVVMRTLSAADALTMPEHIRFPVKDQQDWKRLKKRFDPEESARYPKQWPPGGPVMLFQGPRSPSLFGFVRELMGPERAMMSFYDSPALVHDMMEFNTEFILSLLNRVLREAPISALFFWEDMCYRNGSLISPAMFRSFMIPRYRRMTDLARNLGVDMIFVDCDGNIEELIPLWMESGINGVYPVEVAAGMDVVDLRRRYGQSLLMTGGIDKRALARGQRAIDEELGRTIPLAHQGGYIPHVDHALPHDIAYDNFLYYWKRKKELLGITP